MRAWILLLALGALAIGLVLAAGRGSRVAPGATGGEATVRAVRAPPAAPGGLRNPLREVLPEPATGGVTAGAPAPDDSATLVVELAVRWNEACRNMRVQLLELELAPEAGAPARVITRRDALLDEEGRARFEGLTPGREHALLLGGGEREPALVLARGETRVVRVACGLVALAGLVSDPSGRPQADILVTASRVPLGDGLRVQTAAEGRFAFTSLAAGTWWLFARSDDGRWARLESVELLEAPLDLQLVLEPVEPIKGHAFTADGRPATGSVRARRTGEPPLELATRLDEQGAFRLVVPDRGEYVVECEGHPALAQRTRPGERELEFRLPVREPEEPLPPR